jgi:cob(I)alamin adenosyltransferase
VGLEQDLPIMTDKSKEEFSNETIKELDNICEECKKEDESVSQNLILTSYKLCSSCRVSKTIFPL